MQRTFDAFFHHLIQSTDELAYVRDILILKKKQRLFDYINFNRLRNKQFKHLFDKVKTKKSQTLKLKYLFKWRTSQI